MRIRRVSLGQISTPLKKPFRTALREISRVEDVVVRVETDDGVTGYGEAAPTGVITGDTRGAVEYAIRQHLAPLLVGRDPLDLEENCAILERALVHNSSAKAALDIALHDLWGKILGAPLWRLLGGGAHSLETDCTISVDAPEKMALDAAEAVSQGFGTLKVKVGKDPTLDLERMKAVRDAVGAGVVLRLDANQGWSAKEAIRILRRIEDAGIDLDLVEQPVPGHDLEGLKRVTDSVDIPVLADESVMSPRDALRVLAMRAADLINIKLMKAGGVRGALSLCALAEAAGVEAMMGSMMETKLSVTAAVAVAASRRVVTRIDLDAPFLCAEDPVEGGAICDGPRIALWEGAGLGFRDVRATWEAA